MKAIYYTYKDMFFAFEPASLCSVSDKPIQFLCDTLHFQLNRTSHEFLPNKNYDNIVQRYNVKKKKKET